MGWKEIWADQQLWDRLKTLATGLAALVALMALFASAWPYARGYVSAGFYAWIALPGFVHGLTLVIASYVLFRIGRRIGRPRHVLSIVQSSISLTIHDRASARVTFHEANRVRAEHEGVDSFMHRQWADGGHGAPDIRADGVPTSIESLGVDGGRECWRLRFATPLRKGRETWLHYGCEHQGTFPDTLEHYQHEPLYPERDLVMTIVFPADRRPTRARALLVSGEAMLDRGTLKVTENGQRLPCISWKLRRTSPSYRYRIEWEW